MTLRELPCNTAFILFRNNVTYVKVGTVHMSRNACPCTLAYKKRVHGLTRRYVRIVWLSADSEVKALCKLSHS